MKVAVPKEVMPNERRVALVPDAVGRLVQAGYEVFVECEAGEGSSFSDQAYQDVGATILSNPESIYGAADVVLKVQRPIHNEVLGCHEVQLINPGSLLIAFLDPIANLDLVELMMGRTITSFSMDSIPRIASAQKMDAITSMSSLSGYKAVLIAAHSSGKFFPMMMTAAGTIAPAKGLVLGAGVAGLQAIATARRLGAVMWAFDIRPAVKEQIESLGAKFVEVEPVTSEAEGAGGYARELDQEAQDRERAAIQKHVADSDFVITTALVPGKTAPILITKEMVMSMKPGSVIVDLAAESGGNCELTRPGEEVMEHGISLHGPINIPSSMAIHASQMYSRNISALLLHLTKDQSMHIDLEDAISQACCITHEGNVVHAPTLAMLQN